MPPSTNASPLGNFHPDINSCVRLCTSQSLCLFFNLSGCLSLGRFLCLRRCQVVAVSIRNSNFKLRQTRFRYRCFPSGVVLERHCTLISIYWCIGGALFLSFGGVCSVSRLCSSCLRQRSDNENLLGDLTRRRIQLERLGGKGKGVLGFHLGSMCQRACLGRCHILINHLWWHHLDLVQVGSREGALWATGSY